MVPQAPEKRNLELRVWLPPDGDHRLDRWLRGVVTAAGLADEPRLPPHLPLPPGPVPTGVLSLVSWIPEAGLWSLAVRGEGWSGALRLGLPVRRLPHPPPVPDLTWAKGRRALLTCDVSDPGALTWSWSEVCGWKAVLPKP